MPSCPCCFKRFAIASIAVACLVAGAVITFWPTAPHRTGGPYYFRSWASYILPYRPVDEMTADQAAATPENRAYYIAHYNEHGQIVSFSQYLGIAQQWQAVYFYDAAGRVKRQESVDAAGDKKVINFDTRGKAKQS